MVWTAARNISLILQIFLLLMLEKKDRTMTELEIMKHAKRYLDKLANGINPLDDLPEKRADAATVQPKQRQRSTSRRDSQ